jgi:hypothetical protein
MRDLAYATALLEASERMHSQSDLVCLLPLVVTEASTLISTDCAAIVRFAGKRRRVVDIYLGYASDDPSLAGLIRAVADVGWLIKPGYIDDLSRWTDGVDHMALPAWRSLMIVPLDSPVREDQMRLIWFSPIPRHFAPWTDVAGLFGRHASLAIRRAE